MNKKLIVILVVVLVIIALLIAGACVFFWAYGPKHFINNYFDKIEKGEEFVLEDVYEDFILEDYEDYYVDVENEWKDAENMKYYIDYIAKDVAKIIAKPSFLKPLANLSRPFLFDTDKRA